VGSNDMMALGAMNALYQHNISVPSMVKVVGIDNIQYSAISTPTLTTVSFSQWDIALSAFIMLKELMNGREVPNEIRIPGKLVIRNSV
jgi:LacI family transcriptional regulator